MHHLDLENQTTTPKTTTTPPLDEQAAPADNQVSHKPQLHRVELDQPEKTDSMKMKNARMFAVLAVVAILAGIGTGFGSYKLSAKQTTDTSSDVSVQPTAGSVKKGDVFGSSDTETFKDTATGYLEAGGIDGEGSHKLLRPGGKAQTVYLTSSVTDLDELVGMDIKVWGETYKSQKAGWLMDVGRVEVIDPNGTLPSEE